jgi:hypothetical protein
MSATVGFRHGECDPGFVIGADVNGVGGRHCMIVGSDPVPGVRVAFETGPVAALHENANPMAFIEHKCCRPQIDGEEVNLTRLGPGLRVSALIMSQSRALVANKRLIAVWVDIDQLDYNVCVLSIG